MRRIKTVISSIFLFSSTSWGAVALNNVGTSDHVSATSYSAPFSVTAGGSNLVTFIAITWDGTASGVVATPTYGGQNMTSCGSPSTSGTNGGEALQWFYLVNPPTGSNTLAFSISNTPAEIYVNMISFTGVDQTTPVRSGSYFATVSSQAAGTTFTSAINSNANDQTVSAISDDTGISGTNQTQEWSNTNGISEQYGDKSTTPAASVTHTWTFSAPNAAFVWVGFSIQAAGGSVVTPVNNDGLAINGGKLAINSGQMVVQ